MNTKFVILLAAAAAVIPLISGCSVSSEEQAKSNEDLMEALQHAENGDSAGSRTWCDRAIAVNPSSIDVYVGQDQTSPNSPDSGEDQQANIHDVYATVNDDASIVFYMEQAQKRFPRDWRPWLFAADSDERLGKTFDQLAAAKQAVAIMEPEISKPGGGSSAARMVYLATAYYLAGNAAKAKLTMVTTTTAYQAAPQPLNDLAYYYADSNDVPNLPQALADANLAIKKLNASSNVEDTDNTEQLAAYEDTLGWVEYRQHNYVQAIATLQGAVNEDPMQPEIRYHLGMAYLSRGQTPAAKTGVDDLAAARSEFASAIAIDPGYAAPSQELAKLGPPPATAAQDADSSL